MRFVLSAEAEARGGMLGQRRVQGREGKARGVRRGQKPKSGKEALVPVQPKRKHGPEHRRLGCRYVYGLIAS